MTDITEPFAHVPARGWTPELKARFLDRLAAHGNARAACRAVDLSAEAAYRLRRRDAFFARGWAAALVLARENGVQALAERAIEGVEEQIYYRGSSSARAGATMRGFCWHIWHASTRWSATMPPAPMPVASTNC